MRKRIRLCCRLFTVIHSQWCHLLKHLGKVRCKSYMVTGGDERLYFLILGAKSV